MLAQVRGDTYNSIVVQVHTYAVLRFLSRRRDRLIIMMYNAMAKQLMFQDA